MLCDYLEVGHREGGREAQEGGDMGIYVCIWLIHFVVQQSNTALGSNYTPIKMYFQKSMSGFISLHVDVQLFQHQLLKRLPFLH